MSSDDLAEFIREHPAMSFYAIAVIFAVTGTLILSGSLGLTFIILAIFIGVGIAITYG